MWLTPYDIADAWPPVEIELAGRVEVGGRKDWAWARLGAPVPLAGAMRDRVLVAARHVDEDLWERPSRWPVHVFVATAADEDATSLDVGEVVVAAWGLLHETRERAETDANG